MFCALYLFYIAFDIGCWPEPVCYRKCVITLSLCFFFVLRVCCLECVCLVMWPLLFIFIVTSYIDSSIITALLFYFSNIWIDRVGSPKVFVKPRP